MAASMARTILAVLFASLLASPAGADAFDRRGWLDTFDTERWDLLLRVGIGLDAYVTEHWLVNLELAPSIRFADYGNIPSTSTDNVTLTFSGGIQYRF